MTMHRVWKLFCIFALVFLVIGVALIAAGFFAGSSPVTIQNHGSLDEYLVRLETNRQVFLRDLAALFG